MDKKIGKCKGCGRDLNDFKKQGLFVCHICHDKYCFECGLDYTYQKDMSNTGKKDIMYCKMCAFKFPSDWTKPPKIDKTEERFK